MFKMVILTDKEIIFNSYDGWYRIPVIFY